MKDNLDCYNEDMKPPFDKIRCKRNITMVCSFLFALITISTVTQLIGDLIITTFLSEYIKYPMNIWILSTIPLYLVALPLSYIFIKKADKHKIVPQIKKFTVLQMLGILGVSMLFLYAGSILGTIVTNIITNVTGREIQDTLSELLSTSPWLMIFITTVIIAPFGEEFIFRKLLIDRVNVYGQKFAILLSALTFALFHTNITQLFYTFFLGLVFGYVYVKTGKLRYSIILHSISNFFGGVLAPFILNKLDLKGFLTENLAPDEMLLLVQNNLPLILFVLLYFAVLGSLVITGIVVFVSYRKKLHLKKGDIEIPKNELGNCLLYNAGAVLFVVVSTALLTLNLLM